MTESKYDVGDRFTVDGVPHEIVGVGWTCGDCGWFGSWQSKADSVDGIELHRLECAEVKS